MSSQGSALRLFDLIQSHRVTAVIHVAVKLGLAELLRDGPKTLGELAKATGADRSGRSDVCSPRSPLSAYADGLTTVPTH